MTVVSGRPALPSPYFHVASVSSRIQGLTDCRAAATLVEVAMPDDAWDNPCDWRKNRHLSEPEPIPRKLQIDIRVVSEMLIKTSYYAEGRWLRVLANSPGYPFSPQARTALHDAALIASQFGFPNVSEWIKRRLAK
jgi:hypothetical protein